MSNFRFIHAADIHLDSPMHGIARYEGVPVDEFRMATRKAFNNLIAAAIDRRVDFVVLAGDLFDGDWKDMSTGLYFARSLGKLAAARIPVYITKGNHDAASIVTRELPLPDNTFVFDHRKPQTFEIEELGVALHGRSFPKAQVTDDLATGYPPAISGLFNIGVLHTALTGHPPHADYAPCSPDELAAKSYDYWALGHVHDHVVIRTDPHIVFPGNLQGRNIRETGVKGAVLVEVSDGVVSQLEHVPLDVLRWAECRADCSGAETLEDVQARAQSALADVHTRYASGLPLIARLRLCGETPAHNLLQDRIERLRDEMRTLAAHIDTEFWLEKVTLETAMPVQSRTVTGDEFASLLAEAAQNDELQQIIAEELRNFLAGFPASEYDVRGEFLAAAQKGDWSLLLRAAADSLSARLIGETA